ncbi:hypothetical protein PMAYCL1PPCAC_09552 [Pristionchus mayeri]|uniref:Uncharacterized protein n=1 Tax=Pristionchus mayeri TaxID=1317129 RepID=A0AAN4ZJN6_9BILA|nr:hypothetical protein PMAYCL1PPCAC_09552 [Pristionchus mayeri]
MQWLSCCRPNYLMSPLRGSRVSTGNYADSKECSKDGRTVKLQLHNATLDSKFGLALYHGDKFMLGCSLSDENSPRVSEDTQKELIVG